MNRELAAESSSQPANTALIRDLLRERAALFSELIAADPGKAAAMAFQADLSTRLRAAAPDASLESQGEWEGVAEASVEDDFEHHRSRTHWYLRTAGNRREMFFANHPPRTSGATIRVRGVQSANRIAVAEIVSAAAPAVQQCTTTGAQNIAVVLLTTPSNPSFPAGFDASYFQREFFGTTSGSLATDSLNDFWREASYGQTSATGQVYGPFALGQDYTCDDSGSDALAIAAIAAADPTVDFTQFSRIALVFPVQTCSYGGLGTVGCWTIVSPSKGPLTASMAWLAIFPFSSTALELGDVAHELGHNLGLNHASSDDYGNIPLGQLDDPGTAQEYGDPFSVMGETGYEIGQYSAEHKSLILHWLAPGGYREVESSGIYTLAPYESASGLRALRVLRDAASGAWLWLEYRQPIGDIDSSLSPLDPFNGVLIHYEDPALDTLHTYLLDFNPISVPNNFDTATLTPGNSWSDPYSPLTLSVNSANPSGISVTVRYDQPCASISAFPSSFSSAGTASAWQPITVSAAADCSWTASAPPDWIQLASETFAGQVSGQGNGAVEFAIGQNSTAQQRNAYISIGRQSFPVVQAGTGISVLGVSPNSGSGNSGQFTFQFNDSAGYADVTYISLEFGSAPPDCYVSVSPNGGYLWLQNDTETQSLGPIYFNQPDTSVSNSQCTIYASGSSVQESGDQVAVTLNVSFSPFLFTGIHRVSALASGYAGRTNEISLGTWTVGNGQATSPGHLIHQPAPGGPRPVHAPPPPYPVHPKQ